MRRILITLLIVLPLFGLGLWIADNTTWEDMKVPMPPRGEALTNPFYVAQRFADTLGMRTRWDRILSVPPSDAVIVLSSWHWSLSAGRQQALERWVESGGRLVLDDSLAGGQEAFTHWSGIEHDVHHFEEVEEMEKLLPSTSEACRPFDEQRGSNPSSEPAVVRYVLCGFDGWSFLRSYRPADWILRDRAGIQAVRVNIGRGSVTVINAMPFRFQNLFDGDHARLFVAAAQLRKGDQIVFLSEANYPSLLALTWHHGSPVVVLALILIALALWRGAVRFGPLAAAPERARRSLAEQIRGTGQFALRHGSGDALHTASVRALNEAAQRRVPHYQQLTPEERVAALARVTGFDRSTLAAAVHQAGVRRSHNLRSTIALLESVRRQLSVDPKKVPYATR